MARESGRLLARIDRPGVKPFGLFMASETARREARRLYRMGR